MSVAGKVRVDQRVSAIGAVQFTVIMTELFVLDWHTSVARKGVGCRQDTPVMSYRL